MVRWGRNNEQCAVTCASVQKGAGEGTQSCEPEATDKKEKEKTAKGTILFREEAVRERERERESFVYFAAHARHETHAQICIHQLRCMHICACVSYSL